MASPEVERIAFHIDKEYYLDIVDGEVRTMFNVVDAKGDVHGSFDTYVKAEKTICDMLEGKTKSRRSKRS